MKPEEQPGPVAGRRSALVYDSLNFRYDIFNIVILVERGMEAGWMREETFLQIRTQGRQVQRFPR